MLRAHLLISMKANELHRNSAVLPLGFVGPLLNPVETVANPVLVWWVLKHWTGLVDRCMEIQFAARGRKVHAVPPPDTADRLKNSAATPAYQVPVTTLRTALDPLAMCTLTLASGPREAPQYSAAFLLVSISYLL